MIRDFCYGVKPCLLSFILMLCAISSSAQHRYTEIDSLVLERMYVDRTAETFSVEIPGKMIIAYNQDKTKAIILRNSYVFGKHLEFNVKDEPYRLTLWYKDNHLYCGYIYDKRAKSCDYFEAISKSDKNKLLRRMPFLRNVPSFE